MLAPAHDNLLEGRLRAYRMLRSYALAPAAERAAIDAGLAPFISWALTARPGARLNYFTGDLVLRRNPANFKGLQPRMDARVLDFVARELMGHAVTGLIDLVQVSNRGKSAAEHRQYWAVMKAPRGEDAREVLSRVSRRHRKSATSGQRLEAQL